jgi:superfamily II DNA or RNA helicase
MMSVMVTSVEPAVPRPAGRPALRPDQDRGLRATVRHLRRPNTRALYVVATGTGKTLVSIRAADELGARLVWSSCPRWTWPRRPRSPGAATATWSTW